MTKANEDFDLPMIGIGQQSRGARTKFLQKAQHTIFLDKAIGAPEEYRDEMILLEDAGPDDDVRIVINSPGGRLDSGLMLINGIRACQAPVTALVHEAGSMATGIALACDDWMLGEFSYFMLHTATWAAWGKDQEVHSQVDFMKKYVDQFLKSMYTGFVSAKELQELARGQDMWIDRDGLQMRLAAYAEYREKKELKQAREMQRQYKAMIKEIKNAHAKSDQEAD